MKFDPLNHFWFFDNKKWFKLQPIELTLKKLFTSNIENKYLDIFDKIDIYCSFIGYPRSGHSLIGSLLDAHPEAVISHELDSIKYLKKGFTKEQIFYLILKNSCAFTRFGRRWGKYTYQVPNQWNGRYKTLKVIGDKKGGETSKHYIENPNNLQGLIDIIDVKKIKFIHIVRNPFDNISSLHNFWSPYNNIKKGSQKKFYRDFDVTVNYYFSLCKANKEIKELVDEIIEFKFESFVNNQREYLKKLCEFLELEPYEDYIEDCVKIIFKKPNVTRSSINWEPKYIDIVNEKIKEYDFLKGYSFE